MARNTNHENSSSRESDIYLACKLNGKEQARRREQLQKDLFNKLEDTRETDDGYALKFPGDEKTLDKIFEHTKIEWDCCPFFRFSIAIESHHGPVWLEIGGSKEVKKQLGMEIEPLLPND